MPVLSRVDSFIRLLGRSTFVGLVLTGLAGHVYAQPKPDASTQKYLDESGITYAEWLLYEGICKNEPRYVALALRNGANANTARAPSYCPGQSPLFAALYAGADPEVVALLVRAGADVNARYTGKSSVNRDQLTARDRLLLRMMEATENKQSKEFFPLYYAVDTGNPRRVEIVQMLLEAGADPNARGGAQSEAIFKTFDIEIAKLLIKYGVDINVRNYENETVLAHAKRELERLSPSPYLRPKWEAYCAWLSSQGAHD